MTALIRKTLLPCLILALAAMAGPARAAACGDAPETAVARFHDALLAAMKEAETLGAEGRYARLEPEVAACFDLGLMVRIASGSHWRKADKDARTRLFKAFRRMSVSTYAAQFDGFSGESFETVGERAGPQGTRLVATRINRPDGSPVGLTYVMKKRGETWRIADVLLDDDISQLATRRSEYRRLLEDKGIEGLIASLEAKATRLLAN